LIRRGRRPLLSIISFINIYLLVYSMKPGRVVILLAGRHAGKKAIIVKQYDEGKKVSQEDWLLTS
jgi:hypothetical protein